MTSIELKNELYQKFGVDAFPETYEVNADTYANVCQDIFNKRKYEMEEIKIKGIHWITSITLGKRGGILFKGVELILVRK